MKECFPSWGDGETADELLLEVDSLLEKVEVTLPLYSEDEVDRSFPDSLKVFCVPMFTCDEGDENVSKEPPPVSLAL